MAKIHFTKMVATGNDFVLIDNRVKGQGFPHFRPSTSLGTGSGQARVKGLGRLAGKLCQRKTGIGSDGLLIVEGSKSSDVKMRIFNPDGSEAEMCGNGLRCVALYVGKKNLKIETGSGIYRAQVTAKDRVKVKMEEVKSLRLNLPVNLNCREIKVDFIDTGVPHTVVFVHGLDEIDIVSIGRNIRFHKAFMPRGTNVDFVEVVDAQNIKMRTYERGVEAETSACGTGAVAAAILTRVKGQGSPTSRKQASGQARVKGMVNVITKGGRLKVYFENHGGQIKEVYLEGEAKKVYEGTIVV